MNANDIIVQVTVAVMVLGVLIAAGIAIYRRWGRYRARRQLVKSFEAVSAAVLRDVLIPDGSGPLDLQSAQALGGVIRDPNRAPFGCLGLVGIDVDRGHAVHGRDPDPPRRPGVPDADHADLRRLEQSTLGDIPHGVIRRRGAIGGE